MRRLVPGILALLVAGCGAQPSSIADGSVARNDSGSNAPDGGADGGGVDAGSPTDSGWDGRPDAGALDAGARDAGGPDAGAADAGNWRSSLGTCWTDAACPRRMAVAHGGAWTASVPYDSNGALAAAWALGIDGVKIDVRVTADDIPVIAHSSPIQLYESLDCYNKTIETMTAVQVTACHRLPSTTETFQRLDDVLNYLRGKMVVQLTVKRPVDYARTIAEVHARNAEDFAFLEISTAELQTLIPTLPGSSSVWYLINVASNPGEVDTLVTLHNPRAFMVEFDPTVQLGTIVTAKLRPAGMRSFTYDSAASPTVQQLRDHFDQGFQVVSAQNAANDLQARQGANQAGGVSPP